jgi:hypothetical protein
VSPPKTPVRDEAVIRRGENWVETCMKHIEADATRGWRSGATSVKPESEEPIADEFGRQEQIPFQRVAPSATSGSFQGRVAREPLACLPVA